MRRAELLDVLEDIRAGLGLSAYMVGPQRIDPVGLVPDPGTNRVYLGIRPDLAANHGGRFAPGKLGLVQVDLPVEQGRTLELADVAAKSTWFDHESGSMATNPEAISTYDRMARRLRRHLQGPTGARNVVTGASGEYRTIRYSEGARVWAADGGELRQRGVNNIVFYVPPTTVKPPPQP